MGGSSSKTVAWFHENQGEITDLAEDTQAMRNMIATYVNSLQATIKCQYLLTFADRFDLCPTGACRDLRTSNHSGCTSVQLWLCVFSFSSVPSGVLPSKHFDIPMSCFSFDPSVFLAARWSVATRSFGVIPKADLGSEQGMFGALDMVNG
jgi:hypothetical protein